MVSLALVYSDDCLDDLKNSRWRVEELENEKKEVEADAANITAHCERASRMACETVCQSDSKSDLSSLPSNLP